MYPDGKCIWEYCDAKCECSECANCPHYRPDYKEEKQNYISNIIVGMTILYGLPAVLYRYDNGFAWKYKDETKDLGDVSEQRAIEMFEWNFNKCL